MSVRNAIVLFLALSTLSLLIACGSSSPRPNPVGFSKSSLNGTYVFSSSGVDFNGAFLAAAGTLVANGNGGITGGTMDVVGVEVTPSSPVAQAITGSYSVGPDGRGQATLNSAVGSITLDFVLTSTSHGLVTEFDSTGTGSGTIDSQTAVTSLSQLQGPYAFSFGGVDSTFTNPLATVGAFTFDSAGNITAGTGVVDSNDSGVISPNQALSSVSPATLGSGTGPETISVSTTLGELTFDFYPIDATHLKFIETDYINGFLAGDAFTQTGASIPNGPMVFTMAGGTATSGPIAVGGVMTSDGTGNFTAGLEDVNDSGSVSATQLQFSGIPVLPPGVGGRLLVNLTGFVPAIQWAVYPSSGGLLMLETDSASVTTGAAYAQTSTTLAASNYGLNLSATNLNAGPGTYFEEDDIAQFLTTTSTFTGAVDINDDTTLSFDQGLSGSFPNTPPVDATGRGIANTTNFANFDFYVVNSSTILLLETDSNQVGAGVFELQSAPTPGAAQPAISSMRPAISLVHPAVRPRGAIRHAIKP
jgi:hypothetical protein